MELFKRIAAIMKSYADEVVRSAYDLTLYREVRRTHKLPQSVKYLLKLQVLVVLLYTGVALSFLIPLPKILENEVTERIPEETFFEVKDGKFDTNLPEDWSIKYDDDFMIDTDVSHEGINPPDMDSDSWLFFGREAMFAKDDKGIKTVLYKDLDDFRSTKEEVLEWIDDKLMGVIAFFLFIVVVAGYAFSLLMYGSMVGFGSLFASGLSRLMKANISLERWLVMGPRMLTLPILVTTLLWALGVTLPFAFMAIYLMVILAVIFDEKNNPLGSTGPSGGSAGENPNKEEVESKDDSQERKSEDKEGE